MSMDYENWCRRIDLNLRAEYPYLTTSIYKISTYDFLISIDQDTENREEIEETFNNKIRYITTPVKIAWKTPENYEKKLNQIDDKAIPSNFEGLPFTTDQFHNHILCTFPSLKISSFEEDFSQKTITITLKGTPSTEHVIKLEKKLKSLETIMQFKVKLGGIIESKRGYANEVFIIGPSSTQTNFAFLERDEKLWFDNVDSIYNGTYTKKDLYFTNNQKTSCLANFTLFKNCNLRSLILLYDIVYCILPLNEKMKDFLEDQNISKNDLLHLVSLGR